MWRFVNDRFEVVETDNTFLSLGVFVGWYPSKSAAQRGVERGELYWMVSQKGPLQKVENYKQELPIGWPVTIARKKPHPMWAEFLRPRPAQSRRVWTRIWKEQPIRWWDDLLGRLGI